jgi:hypothetical protein
VRARASCGPRAADLHDLSIPVQVLYESELAEDKRLRADDYYQPVPLVNGKVPDDQAAVGDAGLTPGRIFNNALRRDDQSMDEWLETPSRPGPAGGEKASASN